MADIGLDENPADEGVFRKSGLESDKGKFKIPSLRNSAVTGPYMHDGRFQTLEDVIEHYSVGIENSDNLDVRLTNADGSAKKFNIPSGDKRAIVAFLHSMTDPHMIGDPKFSNPFKVK
jgi:cytochrome c peroxidase